jgi:uncharacterized protein YndB with AHSA1/START domain
MSDLGEITACWTITFHRYSKHSAERLWGAITDADQVSTWMHYPARIDLRVGGDYYIDFSRTNEGALDGVIVRIAPERTLAVVWGHSVLEWTIEPDGDGCRYTFADHGNPTLGGRPEGIMAGWHRWLDDLGAHLNGVTTPPGDGNQRWRALQPPYRQRLDEVLRG